MKKSTIYRKIDIPRGVSGRILRSYAIGLFLLLFSYHAMASESLNTGSGHIYGELQQQNVITGTVTNEAGEPIIGATVTVKGTMAGTITDVNGNFTLDLPAGAEILVVSYVGMLSQEIEIGAQTTFNVALQEDLINLEELVVIGYGTVKRSEITSSISSVKAEELEKTSAVGLDMALQGRAAGVQVIPNSGSPGSSATVNIRGTTSINSYGPLYVVDGVPMGNVFEVNTADIESIEILKDASATGIYGTQAAGGVILVKTKTGKVGQTKVSYRGSIGTQEAWKMIDVLDGPTNIRAIQEAYENDGASMKNPWLQAGYDTEMPDTIQSYDWASRAYRSGLMHNNQIAISGGENNLTYYLSFNNQDQEGIIKGTDFKLRSFRMNNSYKPSEWMKVTQTLNIVSKSRSTVPEWGIWPWGRTSFLGYVWNPTEPFMQADSTYTKSRFQSAPHIDQRYEFDSNRNDDRMIQNVVGVDINPFDGLTISSKYALSFNNGFNKDYDLPMDYGQESNDFDSYAVKPNETTNHLITTYATYDKEIGQSHFSVMVGAEQSFGHNNGLAVSARDMISTIDYPLVNDVDPELHTNTISYTDVDSVDQEYIYPTEYYNVDQWYSEWRRYSYFSRLNYSFAGKYFFTGTLRVDGSSKFPVNNKWGYFPAFSLGWDVSNEDFYNSSVLNRLFVRAGWGQVGNDRGAGNVSAINLRQGFYPVGGVELTHAVPESPGNPNATWETTTTTNIGIDFGLMQNKLSGSFELYDRVTSDMLLELQLVPEMGYFASDPTNIARMSNKGMELTLNYKERLGDLILSVGGNISFLKNVVTDLAGEESALYGTTFAGYNNLQKTVEGRSYQEFYVLQMDGIFQSLEEVDAHRSTQYEVDGVMIDTSVVIQPYAKPGDIRFKDLNNDGIINEEDRDYSGSPFPKFTYGFNISAEWKIFDFNMFLQGVFGNKVLTTTPYFLEFELQSNLSQEYYDNRWTPDNMNNDYPRLTFENYGVNSQPSTYLIRDGSFLRCRNIEIGATIPGTDKMKIDRIRIYGRATNLFTITGYTGGLDPEIGTTNGSIRSPGFDAGIYPQAKTFLAGIQIDF